MAVQTVQVSGVTRPTTATISITGLVICGDGHVVGGTGMLFGWPTILWQQFPLPLGVPSAQQFGQITPRPGPVWIPVPGVGSAQQFGEPLAYLAWVSLPQPPGEMLLPVVACASVPLDPVEWAEETLATSAEESLILTPSVEE